MVMAALFWYLVTFGGPMDRERNSDYLGPYRTLEECRRVMAMPIDSVVICPCVEFPPLWEPPLRTQARAHLSRQCWDVMFGPLPKEILLPVERP